MAIGHLQSLAPLADGLAAAASAAASTARRKFKDRPRTPRGVVPRPGLETPLWNELAAAVERALRRRGEKVRLARFLGISRQRLHVLVVAKTACPDAERTLQLLAWWQARRQGLDPI